MSDPSFQRALLATARVAGLAGLVACGPRGVIIQEGPVTEDPAAYTEPVCEDLLPALVADFFDDWALEPASEATGECCAEFVAEVDATQVYPADEAGLNTLTACCNLLEYPPGLACTPWGPPAPPAMRAVA